MTTASSVAETTRPLRLQNAGPSQQHGRANQLLRSEKDLPRNGTADEDAGTDDEEYDDDEDDDEDLGQSFFVRALYSFQSNDASSLSFRKGDIIEVLTQLESGWWDGLLNSEVRGWFPSNYVERIDDAEAESILVGQEASTPNSARSGEIQYEDLGLANEFEPLRRLMDQSGNQGGSDAFEQLAEATMTSSRDTPLRSGLDSSDLQSRATPRRSRISDQSSLVGSSLATPSEMHSFRSQTEMSSVPSRSTAPSVFEADGVKKGHGHLPASGSLPDMSDRGSSLAQSTWLPGDPSHTVKGRPRAQTTVEMPGGASQSSKNRSDRDAAGRLRLAGPRRLSPTSESDFWVPKQTERGDIIYVNTRTGAQSRDIPEGIESPKSIRSPVSERMRMGRATATTREPEVYQESMQAGPSQESQQRHRLMAQGASTTLSHQDEGMPDPREVPWPWVMEFDDDDETSYHFFNRQTMQSTDDISKVFGRRGSNFATAIRRNDAKGSSNLVLTDEQDAWLLQETMSADESTQQLQLALEEASEDVGVLTTLTLEPLGSDGLSDNDRAAIGAKSMSSLSASRLGQAIDKAVRSVRDALHLAGAIGIGAADLIASSELIRLIEEDASLEAFGAFCAAITALQVRDGYTGHPVVQPHVSSGLAAAEARDSHATLQPTGRRVCALLSKLVLSARSVIEHSHMNVPTRPAVSQAQLEKIVLYRRKIHDDSSELSRVLHVFEQEVERIYAGTFADLESMQRGHLRSGPGTAGIGLETLGGGSAAGWKGNGFVLPSALEAAALRAEARGEFQAASELNADARLALSTGKIGLRRKPGLPFSRRTVEGRLAAPIVEVNRQLMDLQVLARSPEYRIATKEISSEHLTPSQEETLLSRVRGILEGSGHVLAVAEEFDLASALDVDGPAMDYHRSVQQSYDGMESFKEARETLHELAATKQRCYDAGSLLLMQVQDLIAGSSSANHVDILDDLFETAKELQATMKSLNVTFNKLADVHESQTGLAMSALGLRAKVYGIDDVDIGTSESGRYDSESILDPPSLTRSASQDGSKKAAISGRRPSLSDGSFPGPRGERASSRSSAKALKILGDLPPPTPSVIGTDYTDGAHSLSGPLSAGGKAAEVTPWYLQPDTPPEDIIYSDTGQVKGGTLAGLMERLTTHVAYDSAFNQTFLLTYQSFTTTDEFLDLLFARFRISEPEGLNPEEHSQWVEKKQRPIKLRVFNVLKAWIESYCIDGENDAHLERIKTFALDEMQHSPFMASPANLLLRSIERRSGKGEKMKITMVMPLSAPPPLLPKNLKKIKFLDIDPLEMARQLTLMDSKLYNRIRPSECLNKAWSRDNGAQVAKAIRDVISANNRVSGWVSEAILVQEDLKKRAGWVKHFVAIADRCFYLNNFSSMMAIYSGLNNASLNRLRRTWDAVNQRHLQLFENMRALLAPTRNFSKYRETLRKLQPPCVPFLGVYLTDLTFIEDGNSDRMRSDERLINFGKRQMTAEKIQEIVIYQSTPYNLTPVAGIQKFIEENLIEARSDDELFDQSLRLEPREREDEKIARLLQESGFL